MFLVCSNSLLSPESITQSTSDDDLTVWSSRLAHKFQCLHQKLGNIFLYHMRKTAGTTISQMLNIASWRFLFRRIYILEGITLDPTILEQQSGLLTVTSFRHPIDRIISLYWYEHAAFHYARNASRMVTIDLWFDAWCDGTAWKTNMTQKNPGNVETTNNSNYYYSN